MTINIYVNAFARKSLPKKCSYAILRGATPLFYVLNTYMKDKKAAKLIIKRAKRNPFLYSAADLSYARKVKKLENDALSHQETQSS